jgi:hypothetical protein
LAKIKTKGRSKFDLGDARQAIQKLEQKIVGLEVKVAYWEGKAF